LQEEYDLEADYVGGVAIGGSLRVADAVFIGRYITAVEDYESTDESTGEAVEAQPSAYQVEAGYNFGLGINLEYTHDTDYDEGDGGTGAEADVVIAQLYYEF